MTMAQGSLNGETKSSTIASSPLFTQSSSLSPEAAPSEGGPTYYWVAATTSVGTVAGFIAHNIGRAPNREILLRVIGAGALNQAMKGIILARRFVATEALNLVVVPGFQEVTGHNGQTVNAILLACQAR